MFVINVSLLTVTVYLFLSLCTKVKYDFRANPARNDFSSHQIISGAVLFAQTHTIYRTGFSCSWDTARRTRAYWGSTTTWPCWTRCRLSTISWERKSIIRWGAFLPVVFVVVAGYFLWTTNWHFSSNAARLRQEKNFVNFEIAKNYFGAII